MARIIRNTRKAVPGTKPKNGYVLPTDKLEQREKAFQIFRDMGKGRTLNALATELKLHYKDIAVTRQTLEKWSRMHQWVDRCKAHDDAVTKQPAINTPQLSPEFDQVDKLLSAAHHRQPQLEPIAEITLAQLSKEIT